MELSFSNPKDTLKFLTSENVSYTELSELSEKALLNITELHTNKEGRKFQAVTQCILECLKILHNFSSSQWISETKLFYELKDNEKPINFTRINAKGEACEYSVVNCDQVDFDKPIEFADEYKIIPKQKNKEETKKEESNDFLKVLTLLTNGENVFLTGYAGTGKSYILNKLKEILKKKLTITSTTGIAAVNVKGQTIHSWAGVGLCKNPIHKAVEKIRTRTSAYKQIMNCKILAIDEISMLNPETFEYIDSVLREVREVNEPFGGIQVLFIGDFFQLPPVDKEREDVTFSITYENQDKNSQRKYCFDSPLWSEFHLKNVVLKKNFRQSEEKFINALSHMRTNKLNSDDIELLKSRETHSDTFETNILHIFSTNEEANRYNLTKFNMIDEPPRIYTAQDAVYRGGKPVYSGFSENEKYILNIFGKNCRAEKEIALKKGARAMLLLNMDFNRGLINGSCGTILECDEDTITIKFDNGIISPVAKNKFEYFYHDKLIAERTQFPLRLAYGITIHKSQGMTLEKLVVDCSKIFERGQAYVAMSRVKTISGLYLKSFTADKVMVDERVSDFYNELKEVGEVEPIAQLQIEYEEEKDTLNKEEIKTIIKDFVSEFEGLYGKSGIAKVLAGSKSIKSNGYNDGVMSSRYLGILNGISQKKITEIIDEMVEEKIFIPQHINFGRPVLCMNKK